MDDAEQVYGPISNRNPADDLVNVISPQFCAAAPFDLEIDENVSVFSSCRFVVTDINGNILFKVEKDIFDLCGYRYIRDPAGNTLATLRPKTWTAHSRWQVFRGDGKDEKLDFLFSAKTSSMFQFRTNLDVFLANNVSEEVCDFKLKPSWSERSCKIYAGESSTLVAQMHKKLSAASIFLGKDKFMVTVSPNVDYAFIVALIIILEEIVTSRRRRSS